MPSFESFPSFSVGVGGEEQNRLKSYHYDIFIHALIPNIEYMKLNFSIDAST